MKKTKINVPAGIRFVSEWDGFKDLFPKDTPYILDKKIPGCGFTEWVLGNERNTILCSPRVMLIQNKWEQHKDSVFEVYYNSCDHDPSVDIDISIKKDESMMAETRYYRNQEKLKDASVDPIEIKKDLYSRFRKYLLNRRAKPLKIMVTYDSFCKVREMLESMGLFKTLDIYVDEFQSIFTDARFRSNSELWFMQSLVGCKPCYVSATPMMEKYLDELDEFKNLPYYELDWETLEPSRVIRPNLEVRALGRSMTAVVKKIINTVLDPSKIVSTLVKDENGNIVTRYSREVVIYLNSVNNITGIIKRCNLQPGSVNILCSNTEANRKKINKRLGSNYTIGRVPLEGEPNKPITFCTRTVYLGADFYSDNARSFIISDANIDCMSVDISLDLPQILGRQRCFNNPWKSKATLYYSLDRSQKSINEMKNLILDKIDKTINGEIAGFNALENDKQKSAFIIDHKSLVDMLYRTDYLYIDENDQPKMNYLVMLAEKRAAEIHSIDYADRFNMFSAISKSIQNKNSPFNDEISKFYDGYNKLNENLKLSRKITNYRLKYIDEFGLSEQAFDYIKNNIGGKIQELLLLGLDRIRELNYDPERIEQELVLDNIDLKDIIFNTFHIGEKLLIPDIKFKLKSIYDQLGIKKTPKATNLDRWFEIKQIYIKRAKGYEIVRAR